MNTSETIAALCTGTGGAIAIIRISGDKSLPVLHKVWSSKNTIAPRQMILGRLISEDGRGEPALAVYMPAPASYTGENVAEIHCHGGPLSARKILEKIFSSGARPAEPGEFTYRAFMNGKMDLTQAEAVSDIISAHTDMALRLAEKQISGLLKNSISKIRNKLTEILAECESRMDFGEEDLAWIEPESLSGQVLSEISLINSLLASRTEGSVLREGIRAVIAGRPNAGKSSLMNLLLGYERAIVTQIPGTTRDTLEEYANIRNIPVKLIDTAGIREARDIIENMGITRTKDSIKTANLILWVLDADAADAGIEVQELKKHAKPGKNLIAVWNKTDLNPDFIPPELNCPSVKISVKDKNGIRRLLDLFEEAVWGYPHTDMPEIAVSARHSQLLEEAGTALPDASAKILDGEWELAAVGLRTAIGALGRITGESADPDILDNIFSRFCIGK